MLFDAEMTLDKELGFVKFIWKAWF